MQSHYTDNAPKAIGPYAQAISHSGLVFCSGQTPIIPSTNTLLEGTIAEQTRQCLSNLAAVLASIKNEHGQELGLKNVVKTTVFLKDMDDFVEMNKAYEQVFGGHKPARSTVQMAGLPLDARVEIECIATLSNVDTVPQSSL